MNYGIHVLGSVYGPEEEILSTEIVGTQQEAVEAVARALAVSHVSAVSVFKTYADMKDLETDQEREMSGTGRVGR